MRNNGKSNSNGQSNGNGIMSKGNTLSEAIAASSLQSTDKNTLTDLVEAAKSANEIFSLEMAVKRAKENTIRMEEELTKAMGREDAANKALAEKISEKEPRAAALRSVLEKMNKDNGVRKNIVKRMAGMVAVGKLPLSVMRAINHHLNKMEAKGIGGFVAEAEAFSIVQLIPEAKLLEAGVIMLADVNNGVTFHRPDLSVENGERILKVAREIKEIKLSAERIKAFAKFLGERKAQIAKFKAARLAEKAK